MANETDVVTVNVLLSSGGITRAGTGIPMILSNTGNAWATPELIRSYDPDPTAFEADFATTTPEYAAFSALCGQPVKPAAIMVGKGPNKPTQVKTIALSVAPVAGYVYAINAYALGVLQQASYTAVAASAWTINTAYTTGTAVTNDGGKVYVCITAGTSAGATGPTGTGSDITDNTVHWMYAAASGTVVNDVVVYNIAKALNALAAPDIGATAALSGSVGSKIVTITGDAAGNWFALEPLATGDPSAVSNLMTLTDTTADPGVATDLGNILSFNGAWFAFVLLFKSSAIVSTANTGAAAWANSNSRLLLVSMSDTNSATVAYSGGTDCLKVITAANYTWAAGMWHGRDYEWFDAAKLGYFLPLDPGSAQWSLKTYTGPTPYSFTGTQKTNLLARRAAFYLLLGGIAMDDGLGQVCNTTVKWIDTVVDLYGWYAVNLQADLIDLEYADNKLANTNAGRQKVVNTITARNNLAIQQGVMSPDPLDPTAPGAAKVVAPFTVTVPLVAEGGFNAATRQLSGISTRWRLAGAIRSMIVNVNVTQ